MGKALYESFPAVRELFAEASDLLNMDFRQLCFEGPEATLVSTDNVQPAITLVSLAAFTVLRAEGITPSAVAGHSVGEYSALSAAGVFSFADAMRLVQVRGAAMKSAADRHPGGMTAVLGLAAEVLDEVCREVGSDSVQVANHNAPGQVVLTGQSDAVKAAGQAAKARGAKLIVPLKVSGPWHSRFMADAQAPLRAALDACVMQAPQVPVMANVTATFHPPDPDGIRQSLVDQIVSPVLWTQSMSALVEQGCRTFVEVGPGRVLSGLLRDVSRELAVMNLADTESLVKLRAAYAARPN
jgi:[acyl-carrier-protein] S-malonyltransferase